MKKTEIECAHVNLPAYKNKSIYIYELPSKQTLSLCPDCHMVLAGKVMQQLATEVFLGNPPWVDVKLTEKEESEQWKKKKKTTKKK